jgi:hypothetical protein
MAATAAARWFFGQSARASSLFDGETFDGRFNQKPRIPPGKPGMHVRAGRRDASCAQLLETRHLLGYDLDR